MQDLILTENLLDPSNGQSLASVMRGRQHLRHLDLSCCRITDKFCCALCPVLRTASTLTFLNLRGNRVKEEGAQAIGTALVHPPSNLVLPSPCLAW